MAPRPQNVRFQRRILVVHRDVQYSVLIYVLLVSALLIAFNLAASMAVRSLAASAAPYMPVSRARMVITFGLIGVGGVLAVGLAILGGLYLTHRIAGPIWRLHRFMKAAVDEGSREKLAFRRGDHFGEVAETYNRLIEYIVRLEGGGGDPSRE